jgi:hypothetical protein
MRTFVSVFVLMIYCCMLPLGNITAQAERSSTILLVDDNHVLYRSGTKRVFHQLKRYEENPLIANSVWQMSKDNDLKTGLEFHVLPEHRRHTTPDGASEQVAAWILKTIGN